MSKYTEAAEKRWEDLKGHELVPVERSAGKLGGKEVELPHTPPDWTEMRRVQEHFYGPPPPDMGNMTQAGKYWQEKLPAALPYEEKSGVQKAIQDISEWRPVQSGLEMISSLAESVERYIGFAYQGTGLPIPKVLGGDFEDTTHHDPWLATGDAWGTLHGMNDGRLFTLKGGLLNDPEEFAKQYHTLTPEQKRVGAAWYAGSQMYEQLTEFAAPFLLTGAAAYLETFTPFGDLEKTPQVIFGQIKQRIDDMKSGKPIEEWTITPEFNEFMEHIGAAEWMGGDSDQLKEMQENLDRFAAGSYIEEFGGLPEMVAIREAIISGVPPQMAIDAYRQGLGPRLLEAEVTNMTGQILLDPLDLIFQVAKVGEMAKVASNLAKFSRIAPEVLDAFTDIQKIAGTLENVEDVTKLTDEFEQLAKLSDTLANAKVTDAIKDASKLADEGADIADVRKALEPLEEFAKQLELRGKASRFERAAMFLTGGDTFQGPKKGIRIGGKTLLKDADVEKYFNRFFPFTLSAEARADDFVNVFYNNMHVLLRMSGQNVTGKYKNLKNAIAGAFGGALGHMMISPAGRHVQSTLKIMEKGLDDLYQVWESSTGSRRLLDTVADTMKVSSTEVLLTAQKGSKQSKAMFQTLSEILAKVGDDAPQGILNLKKSVADGSFNASDLMGLGELYRQSATKLIPYTPELFDAAVVKLGAETVSEIGALRFGLKEARMIEKAANYVKAGESLVLLGLNPLYPMMNFFNNEITMIARGVGGLMPLNNTMSRVPFIRKFFRSTDDVMSTFGVNPARYGEGFGVAGIDVFDEIAFSVEGAETWALGQGRQSLRTTKWGTPGKVSQKFLDATKAIPDFRRLSATMEGAASARAFTSGMLKAWPKFWKSGVGYDVMDVFSPGLAGRVGDEFGSIIDDAIRNGRRPQDIEVLRAAENLKWNVNHMMRRTAERFGLDDTRVANFVSDEVIESVDKVLKELGPSATPDQVREGMTIVRDMVEGHIDELVDSSIPILVEEATARAATDGVGGVLNLYGEMVDDVTNRHISHLNKLDTEVAKINGIEDVGLRSSQWELLKGETSRAWRRTWNREEAMRKGIVDGLKKRKISIGDDFMGSFRAVRDESTRFIKKRNALWDDYFKKLGKGEYADEFSRVEAAAAIADELDGDYLKLMDVTQQGHRQMDSLFLDIFKEQDELTFRAANEWRTMVREMRRADMEEVGEFRRSIRGIDPDQKHAAFIEHHERRTANLKKIQQMEEYGRVMLHGDEEAMRFFSQNAGARWARSGDADGLMWQHVTGQELSMEQKAQVGDLIRTNATTQEAARLDEIRLAGENTGGNASTVYEMMWEKRQINDDILRRVTGYEGPRAAVKRMEAVEVVPDVVRGNQPLIKMPDGSMRRGVIANRGEIGQVESLPETVYHVTGHGDVIREGGYLKSTGGIGGGGLGGGSEEGVIGVSFSWNRADSEAISIDMQRIVRGTQGTYGAEDFRLLAAEDAARVDPTGVSAHIRTEGLEIESVIASHQRRVMDIALEYGLDVNAYSHPQLEEIVRGLDSAQYARVSFDTLREYRVTRHTQTIGELYDPIFFADDNGMQAFMKMDADAIEILEVPAEQLFHGDNLVLRNVKSDDFLSELRVYGDVPIDDSRRWLEVPENATNPPAYDKLVGKQMHMGTGLDELWFEQGSKVFDGLTEEALKVLDEPNARFADLPANVQEELGRYLEHVTGQQNDAKLASIRFAEGLRDSALLNYSRRYNFDNWMSVVMPYGFWQMHSMGRWAVSVLDYPMVAAVYAKSRQFLKEHSGVERGFPERLRGTVKLDMPFVPDEFGDIFVNPLRSFGVPGEQFTYPFEQLHFQRQNEQKGVEFTLQEMVENGEISQQEMNVALETQGGPVWNQAKNVWGQSNEGPNMMDFIQMSTSLHLPLGMMVNAAMGQPERNGALPHERTIKYAANALGIDPGAYDNVIGNAREALGLPAFDEWDDYRIDRELTNQAGTNEITSEDAQLAMVNRSGPHYEAARQRVLDEETMRFGLRLIGLNAHFYPEGEENQRQLTDQFYTALDLRNNHGDTSAVKDFFDLNPEFEARLALFKEPDVRLKSFLVDQVWNVWFDMPKVNQDAVKDAFGDKFTEHFVNKDTRSLDSISTETLAMWARSMGAKIPGTFDAVDAIPIDLAPDHIAQQVESYYAERKRRFPHYWEQQNEYYDLEEGQARWDYKAQTPAYANFVDWKWDYLYRNPSLSPYIIDDPSKVQFKSIEELRSAKEQEPDFTLREWQTIMGDALFNLTIDEIHGEPLPPSVGDQLDEIAASMGLSRAEVLSKIGAQVP